MQMQQGNHQNTYGDQRYMQPEGGMTAQRWEQEVQRPELPAIRWEQGAPMGSQSERSRAESRLARWRSAVTDRPLDMSNPMSQEAIENPMSQAEVALGSLKGLLLRNLGHYVAATFVVGVSNFVVWRGVLASVGNDYLVIYQPNQDRYISGDFYSLKFVEFYDNYEAILGGEPDWSVGR